jgi:hypothetical protein
MKDNFGVCLKTNELVGGMVQISVCFLFNNISFFK